MKLPRGNYYARMTIGSWRGCPTYKLRLEQLSSVYRSPLLLGARSSAAAFTRGTNGGSKQKTTTWWNDWGAVASWCKEYRRAGYHSFANPKETGSMNELAFRDEYGGKVIKKA